MLHWQNIMHIVLAAVNALYLLSLFITYKFYPRAPIYDMETDVVIGHYEGLNKWHFVWLIPFTMISKWGYE